MREWTTLALVAVTALSGSVVALQASDVGLVDWHLPLIGTPRVPQPTEAPLHRFHHTSITADPDGAKKSLLLTVTEENVLAALQPSSGDVVWRRRFPADNPHPRHLSCTASSFFVLSGASGSDLSSLNGWSGATVWSRSGPRGQAGAALCWRDGAADDVIWLTSAGVSRLDGRTGDTLWSWTSPSEVQGALQLARVDQDHIALIRISPQHPRPSIALQILNSRDGSLSPHHPSATQSIESSNALVVGGEGANSLVWVEKHSLLAIQLDQSFAKPSRLAGATSASQVVDIGLSARGIFLVQNRDGSAAVVSCIAGKLERQWEFSDATASSLFASFVDRVGEAHVGHLAFSTSLQLASLQILSLGATEASPAGVLTGHTFAYDQASYGAMLNFAFEAAPAKEYAVATRSFISTATATVQAWEGAQLAWSREESLSAVDLPPLFWDPVMNSHQDSAASLLARSSFVLRAQRHFAALSNRLTTSVEPVTSASAGHQLVFVASSIHRTVLALDLAQSGRIVWRSHIAAERYDWTLRHRLHMQEMATGRQVVALAESTATPLLMDALTGELVSETAHTFAAAASSSSSLPLRIRVEVVSAGVQGVLSGGRREPLWMYHVGEHEQVYAVVSPSSGAVASAGRILGDRSTLFKYLNPNLVAIVASSPATYSATIHLIDSATGVLVHKVETMHDVGNDSRLSLVMQDNWIVCSHRVAGDAARTSKIISIELFHDSQSSTEVPSINSAPVRGLSRTFSSAQPLDIKTITRTKLGITTYSAIFVNTLEQLVAVPRRILDPRRTFGKPSKHDQEELLLPYDALLPSDPRWVISHQTSLIGLSRVDSFPGRLESESLVLASGLDFFGTRISPSRSFDVLSPTFNKIQLVVTISILSVALGVTRSMVRSRQVRQKWFTL